MLSNKRAARIFFRKRPTSNVARPKDSRVALCVAAAIVFFIVSLSGDLERATSPNIFGLHVVLRKIYSIIAFAIVAWLLARVRRSTTADIFPCALLTALYSAGIEAAQKALGSHEGYYWNVVDILCGFIGGYAGTAFYALSAMRKPRFR